MPKQPPFFHLVFGKQTLQHERERIEGWKGRQILTPVSTRGNGMALRHLMDWIEQQGGHIDLPDIPDSLLITGQKVVGTYNECIEDAEIEYSAKALEAFAQQMVDHGHLLLTLLKKR